MDSQDQDQSQSQNEDQDPAADPQSQPDAAANQFVIAFAPYFEVQKKSQWSWITVAVMLGNFYNTGLLKNGKATKWTQEEVITRCMGTANLNVAGSPDRSMNVTMVYSPLNSGNASVAQSLGTIRAQIRTKSPVVVGWGTPQGDQLGNPKYIVVYGYSGDNWFYADPSKNNVTKNAPLPIPKTGKLVTKVVYSRNPALRMR